ncbi:MAG: hypothetical protein ACKE8G_06070 [Methylophagaceae bacterium]
MKTMEAINMGKSLGLIDENTGYGKSLLNELKEIELNEENKSRVNYLYVNEQIVPSKVGVSTRDFKRGINKDKAEEVYRKIGLATTNDAFRKGIRALRAVLYVAATAYNQNNSCIAYCTSSVHNKRYKWFSVDYIRKVIQALEKHGYGRIERGSINGNTPYRFFPSEDKADLWDDLFSQVCIANITRNVVVKTNDGRGWNEIKDWDYRLPRSLKEKEQQIIKYKEYMLDKDKPIQVLDKDKKLISLQALQRQFHLVTDKSDRYLPEGVKKDYLWGRLSGSRHINMEKEDRKLITIDGEPVIALDFRNAQLQLLYKSCDLDMPEGDGYLIKSCSDRDSVKDLFTSILGRVNRSGLIGTVMKYEFIRDSEHAHMVDDEFYDKHQSISHLFCVGVNEYLTRMESDIIMDITCECVDNNIPVLTVHDEVICKKSDIHKVKSIMTNYLKYIK